MQVVATLVSASGHCVAEFPTRFGRDGFLATNSLLATCIVLARSFHSQEARFTAVPTRLVDLIGDSLDKTRDHIVSTVAPLVRRQTLHIIYAGIAKTAAVDLETRLSEAALTNTTLSDLRSFGHGDTYGCPSMETKAPL